MPSFKIEIDLNNFTQSIEALGYEDKKCLLDAGELQKILGMETVTETKKAEAEKVITTPKKKVNYTIRA